ncbi:MAG: hypothetical protein CO170_01620, partial [candidate division SR1 bacterium CG_4_9_14_3_um_filter_40_9]
VEYLKEREKGEFAEVQTKVVSPKVQIPLDYRLLHKNGEWRVYDVVIDGVSGKVQSDSYCNLAGTGCKTVDQFAVTGVTGADGGNNYITGMSFDSGMNILTLYRTGLSVVTGLINLSGVVNWNTAWGWNSSTGHWNSSYTWIQTNSGNATAWTKSGTDVYYTGGNVGIGTNAPASALDVNGAISSNSLA